MQRLLYLCGALAILAQSLLASSPIGVFLDFEQLPSDIASKVMRKEASELLQPSGLQIAWRLVAANDGTEPFERLIVARFTGKCGCEGFLHRTREILVLGSTAISSGRVLPYVEVRCDSVRRLMPDLEFSADRREGDASLGRILGRVLAHEIYHAITGSKHHGPSGVAKALQSTEELKSDDFSFGESDAELLRAAPAN